SESTTTRTTASRRLIRHASWQVSCIRKRDATAINISSQAPASKNCPVFAQSEVWPSGAQGLVYWREPTRQRGRLFPRDQKRTISGEFPGSPLADSGAAVAVGVSGGGSSIDLVAQAVPRILESAIRFQLRKGACTPRLHFIRLRQIRRLVGWIDRQFL